MILVTGGAGFIGTNFIQNWLKHHSEGIVNLDKLTYAANKQSLEYLPKAPQHIFIQGDIADRHLVKEILETYSIRAVIHFAAESHVDRAIDDPSAFIETNIIGTFHLLESVRAYYLRRPEKEKLAFRFIDVSTDEVYGTLDAQESTFLESRAYSPNNPYAASKAAADHLVRAWHETYGLPVITTHCSNNYGAFQFPEKLIPLMILNAINHKPLPIYGDGQQIRDWLFVEDHCAALEIVIEHGIVGETYNIGGANERTNLETVQMICNLLDELRPRDDGQSYQQQITFVKDRVGHDRRYAINANKIKQDLGWVPKKAFLDGLKETIQWYLNEVHWLDHVASTQEKSL